MSCYINYPSHIGILAASYCEGIQFANDEARRREAGRVAHILAQQNIASVSHHYPTAKEGQKPGPNFVEGKGNDEAIISLSVAWAQHYASHKVAAAPIELIKLAQCFDSNSCNAPHYELTNAAKYIQQIVFNQTRKLKGYQEAAYDWADIDPPKHIIESIQRLQEVKQ